MKQWEEEKITIAISVRKKKKKKKERELKSVAEDMGKDFKHMVINF